MVLLFLAISGFGAGGRSGSGARAGCRLGAVAGQLLIMDFSSFSRWLRSWGLLLGAFPNQLALKWLLDFRGPLRAWNQRASRAEILISLPLILLLIACFSSCLSPASLGGCWGLGTAFVGNDFAATLPPLPETLSAGCLGCPRLGAFNSFSELLLPRPSFLNTGRKVLARRWTEPRPWWVCLGRLADGILVLGRRQKQAGNRSAASSVPCLVNDAWS